WFSYNDQKLGQGRDNVKELLKNDPELMKEIEDQVMARKDELGSAPAAKKEKKGKAAAAAKEAAEDAPTGNAPAGGEDDILANIDEDFEEFTPAEE
ncbi:MAG: DNA recombination/repair protein RecA, partial [Ruminococcus sp.]|nr:DNA recombination/repair protein RecA [Ruminococcus sp.]